jgi:PilZ domain
MATAAQKTLARERRRETRVPVQIPMLVRGMDRNGRSFEERTVVQNLSSGGAAFTTLNDLGMGSMVVVSIPDTPSGLPPTEFSTKARVVYSQSAKNTQEITIGVKFIGPRFQRTSISLWA